MHDIGGGLEIGRAVELSLGAPEAVEIVTADPASAACADELRAILARD